MDLGGMYRDIVESSPDGIWVIDLEGRTQYANPAIARLYGVPVEELAGLTVFDTLDDLGRRQFAQHLAEVRSGQVNDTDVDVQFVRRDGTRLWVLVSETILHAPDGTVTGVLHRFTDYTERREVLDELQESRARLAEAHRIARIGSWEWQLETDEIHASPELLELYGLDAEAFPITYEAFLAIVHPDDRGEVDAAVQAALAGAEEFLFVARVQGHDDWTWTRGRGVVHRETSGRVWMSGTHQDVTEARLAEEALRDQVSQNVLMQAVASAANEATTLAEVLEHARSLVLLHDDWRRARAFVPTADRTTVVPLELAGPDSAAGAAAGAEAEAQAELDLAREALRRREPVWDTRRLTLAFPVLLDGEVCAVVTVASDPPLYRHDMIRAMAEQVAVQLGRVAERERSQRELADARDQAMEASRQKSEFLATMTHEIRTPLNGVIGLNDLLLRTELTPEQQRLAAGVQVASRALLGVLSDVLDFSKIEAGELQLEVVDLEVRALLEQVTSVLGATAEAKGLDLVTTCHPDVPERLAGDPTRLAQVLANLVSNAVKFTEEGEVLVQVRAYPGHAGTTVLRFDVTDTGIGVPEAQLAHLFEPFTQADASTTRRYGGTGLGLAISRDIAKALGGEVSYAANPGGGSTFSFTAVLAPATGGLDEAADQAADEEARALLRGKRVLVIGDDQHDRLPLEERLGRWKVRAAGVPSALDGLRALRRAAAEKDPFDGVLVAVAEPLRDAVALARDVRRDRGHDSTALLLLSTLGEDDAARASAAGIDECLAKPVSPGTLRDALVRHLGDRAGHDDDRLAPAPQGGRRVLVVEDNPMNQMVALGLLTSMGYVAQAVDDGVEALEVLAEETFDAILMDVQMPRMDGYSTTRAIRARETGDTHLPVIAMTATAVEGERERCLAAGMDEFLTKPVDPAALATTLARWVQQPATNALREPDPTTDATTLEAHVTPPSPADGLDRERLDMLRDLDPGSTSYLDRAIGNFMESSTTGLEAIQAAVAADDPGSMRAAAHKLAGSALNLGVVSAGEAAQRIELLGDADTCAGAPDLLVVLEDELDRGRAALRAYQASYGA